jgi:hypothetical protein
MPGGSSGSTEARLQSHLRSTTRGPTNNQEITLPLAGLLTAHLTSVLVCVIIHT